jgi:hypothetical protein
MVTLSCRDLVNLFVSVTNPHPMGIAVESNPYTPPETVGESSKPSSPLDRRFVFLLMPPLIPLGVHVIVRFFVPADETLYHAMFTLGAIIPA